MLQGPSQGGKGRPEWRKRPRREACSASEELDCRMENPWVNDVSRRGVRGSGGLGPSGVQKPDLSGPSMKGSLRYLVPGVILRGMASTLFCCLHHPMLYFSHS